MKPSKDLTAQRPNADSSANVVQNSSSARPRSPEEIESERQEAISDKIILGLIIATVAIPLLYLFDSGDSGKANSARHIERVLEADSRASEGATSVAQISGRMRAIDLRGCSQEFAAAYLEYLHAWEQAARLEQEFAAFDARFNSGGALVEAFVRGVVFDFGMIGEESAERDRLLSNFHANSELLQRAFHKVEKTAVASGVLRKFKAPGS